MNHNIPIILNDTLTNFSFNNEGIGSIFQYILSLYLYCQTYNKKFVYTPIKEFEHFKHNNTDQQTWDKLINKFITNYLIPDRNTVDNSKKIEFKIDKSFLDNILYSNPDILLPLKKYFKSDNTLNISNYFDNDVINICIHVRVYSSTDSDPSTCREYYQKDTLIDKYYQSCLLNIIKLFPDKKLDIHIYSQNTKFDHWNYIKSNNINIITHNGNDLLSDIYHMINSNIFIASKSSLSALVNYYTDAITISRTGFWHTLVNTIYHDINGYFTPEQEKILINYIRDKEIKNLLNIPENIKRIKLDVGLSVNAPQSEYWLSKDQDLFVLGFEPNKLNIENIYKFDSPWPRTLKKRNINRLSIFPFALGNNEENGKEMTLYNTHNDGGCSSLHKPKFFQFDDIQTVKIYSLNHILQYFPWDRFPVIDYIKIDAQGHDLEIVKGCDKYLDKIAVITLEAESHQYENITGNSEKEIYTYFKDKGFYCLQGNNEWSSSTDPTFANPKYLNDVLTGKINYYQDA